MYYFFIKFIGHSRRCTSCKNSVYPVANPVGIVLITDPESQYALLARQPRMVKGMYSCVAGFSDVGEYYYYFCILIFKKF